MRFGLVVALVAAAAYVAGYLTGQPDANQTVAPPAPPTAPAPAEPSSAAALPSIGPVSADSARITPAAADHPHTLAGILELGSDFEQTAALYRLVATADVAELETLLDEAAGLGQPSEQQAAASILYARYADLDPQAALEAASAGSPLLLDAALGSIYHSWSRADLDAALASLDLLQGLQRTVAGLALLNARDDLPEAERRQLASDLGLEASLQQQTLQRQAILASVDPRSAWTEALALTSHRERSLMGVASQWAETDPLAALDAVAGIADSQLRQTLLQVVLQRWALRAPEEALARVLDLPASSQRHRLLSNVLSQLASKDPQLAVSHYLSLSGADQRATLNQLLNGWARTDAAGAARWWASLDTGVRPSEGYSLASRYAQQDAEAAFAWALSLPDQRAAIATQAVVMTVALRDPRAALAMFDRLTDPSLRRSAATGLIQNWTQTEPDAAWRWVETLDDKVLSTQLRQQHVQTLVQQDRQAGLRRLASISNADERDRVTASVIATFINDDIPTAERLYRSISDPQIRAQAGQYLYRYLKQVDPSRAELYRPPS